MSATLPILTSVQERLLEQLDRFTVELFPDDLKNYYVRDEYGTILVQYAGSKFESQGSTDLVHQRRYVHIALTVIARSQHDDSGALDVLDKVRLAIVGFRPTNCEPCTLISEEFAGEDEGLWQYQLIVQTSTWQVEQREPQDLTKFTTALLRYAGKP